MNINIGIIGPRVFSFGGHDPEDSDRQNFRQAVSGIISGYFNNGYKIFGYTGLGLGVEQDFAMSCSGNNITIRAYIPFEKQAEKWTNIPGLVQNYNALLDYSSETHILSKGGYAPKKIHCKNKLVIEKSDILIYKATPLTWSLSDYNLENTKVIEL